MDGKDPDFPDGEMRSVEPSPSVHCFVVFT